MNILHITDLHLEDIKSPNENLRKSKYKEFINGLCDELQKFPKVDIIVCTGDFINKGKVENFGHVNIIFDYLLKKLELEPESVVTCLGNHDILMKEESSGNFLKARKAYAKLESIYNVKNLIKSNDIFKIYYSQSLKYYFLTFDSTFGSKGSNKPSTLTDLQIDEVIDSLDELIPEEGQLIVLSHYPMILFNRSQTYVEVENWVEDHLWKSGNILVERIYQKRKNSLTFWFFGDGHVPDFWSFNSYHHFLMTGMIGGNYVDPTYVKAGKKVAYNKTNEVKLIELDEANIKINTFSYKSKGYEHSAHLGSWTFISSDIRIVDNPFEKKSDPQYSSKEITNERKFPDTITKLISNSVETEIINQIRDRKLYSFNRYATSENEVALGWISLSKLFENNELLSRCIEKSTEWILKLPKLELNKENTIFVGINFWGAIFASQASILSDIENYSIATKAKNVHNVLHEKPEFLADKIKLKGNDLKNIVLFTDVISTGNTILNIKEKITNCLTNLSCKWIAISIISDTKQIRKPELSDFHELGTLCCNLRIPILKVEDLPEISILPVKYDIS